MAKVAWWALPAENLANMAGIPTFEIGNVEAWARSPWERRCQDNR
jgi:hypothetical protein